MSTKIDNNGKLLGAAFREARETIGLTAADYSKLLEMDLPTLMLLERGALPSKPDDKLLKPLLATLTILNRKDFLEHFLKEASIRYRLADLASAPDPFVKLFQPDLGSQLESFPWILENVNFNCRMLQLTDQANGILIWATQNPVHQKLVPALPALTPAYVGLLAKQTIIFIPHIYLFLKFNTAAPNNPVPELLASRFQAGLPVGLAVPNEPFSKKIATQDFDEMLKRIFIYSTEYSLCELVTR